MTWFQPLVIPCIAFWESEWQHSEPIGSAGYISTDLEHVYRRREITSTVFFYSITVQSNVRGGKVTQMCCWTAAEKCQATGQAVLSMFCISQKWMDSNTNTLPDKINLIYFFLIWYTSMFFNCVIRCLPGVRL